MQLNFYQIDGRNVVWGTGDLVLLHSNTIRTLKMMKREGYKPDISDILESFIDVIGAKGTLLLPLFNFDFAKTQFFDITQTPSKMGALTESGRVYSGAVRTGHPFYSFAVIGAQAKKFENIDNKSGYGDDSPFALLRALDGKIASLDLEDQHSMTFYHHVEEMMRVPYRYFKDFSGTYINHAGEKSQKTYQLYVRDIENNVITDVNGAGELLWQAGLYQGFRPKEDIGLRVINANVMFDFVTKIIKEERGLGTLYNIVDAS